MKIRTVIGIAGATAVSSVGMAGLAAGPAAAGGNGAQNMPAAQLTTFLQTNYGLPAPGIPIFGTPFSPVGTAPNVKVSGNCATAAPWLFTNKFALNFVSGNAVVYRGSSNPVVPFLPGGLNAEGTADLIGQSTGDTGFVGPAHVWLGQNANANGTFYAGETVSFTGTAADGSTISITTNPGEINSAGGHQGGWGQQNLTCNIMS
jgi:hypothetical protein